MKIKKTYYFLAAILLALIFLWIFRGFAEKELDDVSPLIQCDQELLDKADVLWVIPRYKEVNITKEWCNEILSLNKEIGMHGVEHTYNEFLEPRDEEYLQEGMEIFKECFGFYPEKFKPGQLAISKENKILVENKMEREGYPNQILNKVYHCNDSTIPKNRFIDFF